MSGQTTSPTDGPANGPSESGTLADAIRPRPFSERHIGPDAQQVTEMLKALGVSSLEALMEDAVPGRIASHGLDLPPAASEAATAAELRELAELNNPLVPMIGLGYHGTVTPPVIRRNVLEDPSWYTAYTPYQPEISQGRLEALLNFQTMVADLTGLPTSNASLLDEGTAAAEAMTLVRRAQPKVQGPFVVDADALPQTIEVVRTRARAMKIEVVVADLDRRPARGRPVRRAGAVPRRLRAGAGRPHRDPGRPRPWSARGRGGRPAGPDAARVTGDAGRRRHRRLLAEVRRPAVLRRAARRLHVRARRAGAAPSGPARRGLGRLRRPTGVPPLAADARAAHPPRPGDVQHLHRPGAAGGRRVDVRRAPRARGPHPDRPARRTSRRWRWPSGCGPAASRSSTTRSSTRSWRASPAAPARWSLLRGRPASTSVTSTTTTWA